MGNFFSDLYDGKKATNPWRRLKSHKSLQLERDAKSTEKEANKNAYTTNPYYQDALKLMQEVSKTGETQSDKEAYQNMLGKSQQANTQNQDAFQANMRKRGQSGSGLEYLGATIANQQGAAETNEMATDRSQVLQANRTSALQSLAQMSGNEAASQNAINNFNAQMAANALQARQQQNAAIWQQLLGIGADVGKAFIPIPKK